MTPYDGKRPPIDFFLPIVEEMVWNQVRWRGPAGDATIEGDAEVDDIEVSGRYRCMD